MSRLGLSGIKLITFDVTGTLIKFRQPVYQTYVEFSEKNGIQVDEAAVKTAFKQHWKSMNQTDPHFGQNWQQWWTTLVVKVLQSANPSARTSQCQTVASSLIQHYTGPDQWEVVPGAEDMLLNLRSDRDGMKTKWNKFGKMTAMKTFFDAGTMINLPFVRLGVISNFDPRLNGILKGLGLDKYFDLQVISYEVRSSKPDKEIFWAAQHACQYLFRNFDENTDCDPDDILHIGNSYLNDYWGSTRTGFNSFLVLTPEEELEEIPESVRNDPKQNITIFRDLFELNKFFEDNLEEITIG